MAAGDPAVRPRLLDLFCGAGGAATGYYRAGFDVVGVDIAPQPNYPFEFIQWDALNVLSDRPYLWGQFNAIHASPPCQRYSTATADPGRHPDLIGPTRELLETIGLPFVIENVPGAPMRSDITLCGSMFGLKVRRHRLFESNKAMIAPPCRHREQGQPWGVYGHGGSFSGSPSEAKDRQNRGRKPPQAMFGPLMGIEWAKPREVVLAIPPVYTQWVGVQLRAQL